MIVRSALTYMLLVYAVYVPSTARHTLVVAALMTVPLLGCIFLAFRSWDPALHDPPAAIWPKGQVGDMAYPATIVSAVLWAIAVAMAAGFSQTIYGLRKAVSDIRRLGQYTLEKKLGEGGMGVVYRASHAMLRRPTAIKLLLPDRAGKDALTRFEREVRRTAMLTHPNTVTVFDYGRTTDGVFYYAMELLEGASLDEIVEVDGPQPEERVIHLLEQAAASLAEAHDAGLIHRDVKPGNILVVDRGGISDLVKVVDFGLVKDVGLQARGGATSEPALTMADTITGTPLYIAPETRDRAGDRGRAGGPLCARRGRVLAADRHARLRRKIDTRSVRSSSAFGTRSSIHSARRARGARSRGGAPRMSRQATRGSPCLGARAARASSRVRRGGPLDQRSSRAMVGGPPPQVAFGRRGRASERRCRRPRPPPHGHPHRRLTARLRDFSNASSSVPSMTLNGCAAST